MIMFLFNKIVVFLGFINKIIGFIFLQGWNKYHLLDLRSKEYFYDYGYIDSVSLMVIAPFRILQDFVEIEKPFEHCDWDWNPEHQHAANEIKELYDWWMVGRLAEEKAMSAALTEWAENRHTFSGETLNNKYRQMESAFNQKDTEQLIRLMKIREYLWT